MSGRETLSEILERAARLGKVVGFRGEVNPPKTAARGQLRVIGIMMTGEKEPRDTGPQEI